MNGVLGPLGTPPQSKWGRFPNVGDPAVRPVARLFFYYDYLRALWWLARGGKNQLWGQETAVSDVVRQPVSLGRSMAIPLFHCALARVMLHLLTLPVTAGQVGTRRFSRPSTDRDNDDARSAPVRGARALKGADPAFMHPPGPSG